MFRRIIPYCTLLLVVLTSTVIAWAPFIMNGQFSTIYKHFDGPLYIIPAKTAYSPAAFKIIDREPTLPHNPLYYAAHLPLYPFFIYLGSFAVGFLKSMVVVTIVSTIFLAWFFYYCLKKLNITKHPLILTSFLLFLPRFLVVRSVGSPEPLFLLLIIGSLFFFEKKDYVLAGLFGGLASMTKTPGVLLFPAYILVLIEQYVIPAKAGIQTKIFNLKWLFLLLIPLCLLAVFGLYYIRFFCIFPHRWDCTNAISICGV